MTTLQKHSRMKEHSAGWPTYALPRVSQRSHPS